MEAFVAPPGLQKYVGFDALVVAVKIAAKPAQFVLEFTVTVDSP